MRTVAPPVPAPGAAPFPAASELEARTREHGADAFVEPRVVTEDTVPHGLVV